MKSLFIRSRCRKWSEVKDAYDTNDLYMMTTTMKCASWGHYEAPYCKHYPTFQRRNDILWSFIHSFIHYYTTWVALLAQQSKNNKKAQLSLTNPRDACESLHGLRKSSGVVSCIARLSVDSVPMVSYYVPYSNCVCKMRRFGATRLLKLPWPWNPGQGSLKVIESDTIR